GATSSSPAARTCGPPRWNGCWPPTPPSPRWRWWGARTPSGASGWWPWSSPPTRPLPPRWPSCATTPRPPCRPTPPPRCWSWPRRCPAPRAARSATPRCARAAADRSAVGAPARAGRSARAATGGGAQEDAAVDDERVAGHPRGQVAGQEQRGVGDVGGLAEATERHRLGDGLLRRLPQRPGHVGLHEARRDGVDPHVGGELGGERLRQVDERGLGGVVD